MAVPWHQHASKLVTEAGENAGELPVAVKSAAGGASIVSKYKKTHVKADQRSIVGMLYQMMIYTFHKEGPSITQDARYATKDQCIVPVLKPDTDIHSKTDSKCKIVLQKMKDYFFILSLFRIVMVEPRRWLRVMLLIFLFVCLLQLWPVLLLFSPLAVCIFMLQAYCGMCAWDNVSGEKCEAMSHPILTENDLCV